MKLDELVKIFDETLDIGAFSQDVSNNGLQVEGSGEVGRVMFAVDACQEVFDAAAEEKADLIFVHHGLSWGGGMKRWTGMDARRFSTLFRSGISLYAAHLPLDAHAVYGNNAGLSDLIGLEKRRPFFEYDGVKIGFSGTLPGERTLGEIAAGLGETLEIEPLLRGDAGRRIGTAAVVSGGGGIDAVIAAKEAGCDLLITGEMEHVMHHPALELGVAVIALGHYASETVGVLAMEKFIAETCPVETCFAEAPTGL